MHAADAMPLLSGYLRALPFDVARSDLRLREPVRDLLDCLRPYVRGDGGLTVPFEAETIIAERIAT